MKATSNKVNYAYISSSSSYLKREILIEKGRGVLRPVMGWTLSVTPNRATTPRCSTVQYERYQPREREREREMYIYIYID